MNLTAILVAAKAAGEIANLWTGLAHTLVVQNRDPTPEEVQQVKDRQKAAEDEWASLTPK